MEIFCAYDDREFEKSSWSTVTITLRSNAKIGNHLNEFCFASDPHETWSAEHLRKFIEVDRKFDKGDVLSSWYEDIRCNTSEVFMAEIYSAALSQKVFKNNDFDDMVKAVNHQMNLIDAANPDFWQLFSIFRRIKLVDFLTNNRAK